MSAVVGFCVVCVVFVVFVTGFSFHALREFIFRGLMPCIFSNWLFIIVLYVVSMSFLSLRQWLHCQ